MSRILSCDPARPDAGIVWDVVGVLNAGNAVVIPTETQYGLLLRADREDAFVRLQQIKKRPEARKPALFVKDLEMAEKFCEISAVARALADRYLPGPLTLVLPPRAGQTSVPPQFLSADGFGIRLSSSPLVAAVTRHLSFPATATSANVSGEICPATVSEIQTIFGDAVNLYLDGGPCRGIVPSTVVKVAEGVEILRHGIISEAEIKSFLQTAGVL